MKALVTDIRNHLRQPWLLSILFIAIIPIFPEYISIPLAGASLWAAARDAKQRRSTLAVGTLGKLLLVFMLYMGAILTNLAQSEAVAPAAAQTALCALSDSALRTVPKDRRDALRADILKQILIHLV